MSLVKENFSNGAMIYDKVARIQPLVAARLAGKLHASPARILEIGCGTGGLSIHLSRRFPDAEIVLTDISAPMLEVCKEKLGGKGVFKIMDGERPDISLGHFDLITSSLAMQWFNDLPEALYRLAQLLTPGGQLAFSTLGKKNFQEWHDLLLRFNLKSGLHQYPDAMKFPWPVGLEGDVEEEFKAEHHESGAAFLKTLKEMGAGAPRLGYKPSSALNLRRPLLASANGFVVTYHILYGFLMVD